jgi:hypothetical protein
LKKYGRREAIYQVVETSHTPPDNNNSAYQKNLNLQAVPLFFPLQPNPQLPYQAGLNIQPELDIE